MDPDQTAPTGAVWSGSTLFIYGASNSVVDDKIYSLWLWGLRVNTLKNFKYDKNENIIVCIQNILAFFNG